MGVSLLRHSVLSGSLRPLGLWPARLLCPWDSPGKNAGAGCRALLQGIFLTQGSNLRLLRLLHWRVLHRQRHLGSPNSAADDVPGAGEKPATKKNCANWCPHHLPAAKKRNLKKKIPLKLGVHCREIQATSHSARGGGESAAQRASHKVLAFSGRGRQGILIFPENKTFQISMFRKRTLVGFHLWEIS